MSNSGLLARRKEAVARGVTTATPVFAASAENARVSDVEGRQYIDFASGIGAAATGHRHPRVMRAVYKQLEQFTHTAFQVMAYEQYVALAERLNGLAPFQGQAKSVFFTTGAEAVENAVKIARIATKRNAIIAFSGAFHGRTMLAAALTGKVLPYRKGTGVHAPGVYRVPFPIDHRGVCVSDTLQALSNLFYADVEPTQVAAIILEPVQGEGGFHVAPRELLQGLRAICDEHGILLIADEVQSGFGRTGRMFAIEHSGVEPDLLTVAKSLAGGFPLSGVLGRASVMDAVEPGGLGGTYGGSPIGCAAAVAVLDVIESEGLLVRAQSIGATIRAGLARFMASGQGTPFANLRGLGAMLAFDVTKAHGSSEPDGPGAQRLTTRAFEEGLILLTCGTYGETVRFLVPLTIADSDLKAGLEILGRAIRRAD